MQIGPRIRIGGSVGKIGQKVKIGAGKALKTVAPVASLIPAIGPGLAALGAGLGTALDTSKGAVNPLDIAKNAALSYGSNKMLMSASGGAKGLTGIKNVGKSLIGQKVLGAASGGSGGATQQGAPGEGGPGIVDRVSQLASGIFGGGGGGGGGGTGLADKLLLGGAVAAGAADRARAQGMQDRAVNYAVGSYDTRAPMREQGMMQALANATSPTPPQYVSTSPYDRQRRGQPQLGQRVPASSLSY